jgi:hypothetical protein
VTLARLSADGVLDTSFGSTNGYTLTNLDSFDNVELENLKVLQDDSILLGGYSTNDNKEQQLLVRYDASGNLDTRFGSGGISSQVTGVSTSRGFGLAIQSTGAILLGGSAQAGNKMPSISRYLSGPAQLEVSTSSLAFADTQNTQTSAASQLSLSNTGTAALSISSLSVSDNFSLSGDCTSINPGDSCTLELSFAPTAEGALTGSLTIVSDLGTSSVDLSGTGLPLDSDNDGVPDASDAFPNDPDETADFDNDGTGDNADTDDDNDLVADVDDAFPYDPGESVDSDSDGTGDNTDSTPFGDDADTDNDGMTDAYEVASGLDIYDPSDADGDLDGDGLSNLDEFNQGSDPSVDDVAPVLTLPADLEVIATGATTVVDLGSATAEDAKDGTITPTADNYGPFAPGHHRIVWTATDAAGNRARASQVLDVIPLVSVSSDQSVGEGGTARLEVNLNGAAASYPVLIPYTLSGTASYPADHDALAGTLEISAGTSASLTINTLTDAVFEGDETLVITLGTPTNAALGGQFVHTLTITEANVAPVLGLRLMQQDQFTANVYADQGPVTVNATVTDPNIGDSYSLVWQNAAPGLSLADGYQGDTFSFDPGQLNGNYAVTAIATDAAGAAVSETLLIHVIALSPALSSSQDSDEDGISDSEEGTGDSNGNRIPDYLDRSNSPHLLPATLEGGDIAVAPGLTLSLGDMAYALGLNLGQLSLADIERFTGESLASSSGYQFLNGIFDFEIRGLSAGSSVQLVLPLTRAIPVNAEYLKYVVGTGWVSFVEDTNNQLASAPGALGVCPAPGSSDYRPGLTPGDFCVQLTLEDGGANDADGSANGVIKDPGAVATTFIPEPQLTVAANALDTTRFAAGDGEKLVFSITLTSDSSDAVLYSLSLRASGELDEVHDISQVKLYRDSNANGQAEAGELVGSGHYSADDGTLSLTLDGAYQLPVGETNILVTYQF